MRIAVIGSGISGLASAWLLSHQHEVTLFESSERLGGHTHTHTLTLDDREVSVDTGFIVFNRTHYPLLTRLFDELGVSTQATTMSFSVHEQATGLEYNAATLDTLFCQRRNLVSPRFLGMIRDLLRFYRQAPRLLDEADDALTLGAYLEREGYGQAFRDAHLVPMASALWSSPASRILEFPVRYLVRFMANHHMLRLNGRPQWLTVKGGSSRYIDALRRRWRVQVRCGCAVQSLQRHADGVQVTSQAGRESFDHAVLACHSDQALALLDDADAREREILSAIRFQPNDVVLHTDARLLPRQPKAWAAWNAWVPAARDEVCTVSYCMNLLQNIELSEPLVVTLNRTAAIDPGRILRRMRYQHPVYTPASVAARGRRQEIQGRRRTWFAGAWWGWGFHEDGMRSAVEVAEALGVPFGPAARQVRRAGAAAEQAA